MSETDTKTTLKEFIVREFLPGESVDKVTDSLPLISGGILDSLSTLKLVTFLEEQFGIEMAAHEVGADNLDTVDKIASFIAGKQG